MWWDLRKTTTSPFLTSGLEETMSHTCSRHRNMNIVEKHTCNSKDLSAFSKLSKYAGHHSSYYSEFVTNSRQKRWVRQLETNSFADGRLLLKKDCSSGLALMLRPTGFYRHMLKLNHRRTRLSMPLILALAGKVPASSFRDMVWKSIFGFTFLLKVPIQRLRFLNHFQKYSAFWRRFQRLVF